MSLFEEYKAQSIAVVENDNIHTHIDEWVERDGKLVHTDCHGDMHEDSI